MQRADLYQIYHSNIKLQKRIINQKDFTYRNLVAVINRFIYGKNKVLDIGCGTGTVSLYIASKNKHVEGVDISQSAVAAAQANAKFLRLSNNVRFYVLDFPRVKIRRKFDLILMTEVLEHIPNDKQALSLAKNSLTRNGLLLISVPLKSAPLNKIGFLKKFDAKVGHLRRYDKEEIVHLVKNSGLKIIYEKETEGLLRNLMFTNKAFGFFIKLVKGPVSDFMTFIDNISLKFFGPSQVLIVAAKK